MWAILLLVLTTLLFLAPLIPALQELQKRRDVQPLTIVPTHHGNIRQFAESFRAFIEQELSTLASTTGADKWIDRYAFVGEEQRFWPSAEETQSGVTQRVIVAWKRLTLPDNFAFQGEIYGRGSVCSGLRNQLRGVLVEQDLFLQRESVVLRWAHARSAYVGEACFLFGRMSVEETLVLDLWSRFVRINARRVQFGAHGPVPEVAVEGDCPVMTGKGKTPFTPAIADITPDGRLMLEHSLEMPANSFYRGDMVVCGDILIGPGSTIVGSIKGHGNVVLGEGVHVGGSVVCGQSLVIGTACTIGGPVIAENETEIGGGVAIGAMGRPTTVSAARIRVTTPATVYGTVWAREEGIVMPPPSVGNDIT